MSLTSSTFLWAEASQASIEDQLESLSISLTDIADENDAKISTMQTELIRVQKRLGEQDNNIVDLTATVNTLKEKIAVAKATQKEIDDKFDEINLNYEKYVFRTRTKAIVPFIYGALAFTLDGSEERPLLYALAGYGTGALIENTGYGLSSGITWLWYSFSF